MPVRVGPGQVQESILGSEVGREAGSSEGDSAEDPS